MKKELRKNKNGLKVLCCSTFILSVVLSAKSFAFEFDANLSDEYKEWTKLSNEEKEEILMPQTIYSELPSNILEKYEISNKVPNFISTLLTNSNRRLGNISDDALKSKYSLNEKMDLRVENQKSTTECWAFSSLKTLETNIALNNNERELKNFSERHMDYSTTKTFTDGTNPIGYNRELGGGGLPVISYSYLTNGTGAILEDEMPFEDNERKISLSEINKNVDTIVTDYITLPTINKEYKKDEKGNTISIKYIDASGKEYTEESLKIARNIIKKQLVTNGAISSITAGNKNKYYDTTNIYTASNYNCNSTTEKRDHGITIVGWDDNYSKYNFRDGARPSSDGAYLVLNSYGSENFDNGYMYISYEDFFIESEIYGVQSTQKVDYDKIYQHDFFGGIFQIGTEAISTGYYGVTFDRDSSKSEKINSVGVNLSEYCKIEIYINPNSANLSSDNLIKVAETEEVLSPGYHRIDINSVELNSNEFSIVVKQISENDEFSFKIETRVAGTAFSNVSSDNRSYFSSNAEVWQNLSEMSVPGIDMNNADVCIKAFTTNVEENNNNPDNSDDETNGSEDNEIVIEKYKVENDYILNIENETKKVDFMKNISTNLEASIVTENGEEIVEDNELIKTGMKLKLSDGKMYILIVRGDINKDGKLTLTDISKLLLHYNGNQGFTITDVYALKGCDMNFDGEITLTDLSQIIVLYNSIEM